jgi:hypothetical protein
MTISIGCMCFPSSPHVSALPRIDGNAEGGATLPNAQEVRNAALKLALANDVLVKMRDVLNRIPVRQ